MQVHSSILDSEPSIGAASVASAARDYRSRDYAPIPLFPGTKQPISSGWNDRPLTAEEIDAEFSVDRNIGLVMGRLSGRLVDVDVDCREAEVLAATFLPNTDAVFGRAGHPRLHYLYRVTDESPTKQFLDTDGSMLVEFRSTDAQTMVPPSLHPDGERVRWDRDGEPGVMEPAKLVRSVEKLAAASMIARHWPSRGSRHHAANALIGGLLRAGWADEDVREFVQAVAEAAGDEEARTRLEGVRTAVRRLAEGKEVTGFPRLASYVGPAVVAKAAEFLGIEFRRRSDSLRDGLTDLGNAERLVTRHGGDLRYCQPWRTWMVWDGRRWGEDTTGEIHRRAKETIISIYGEAGATPELEQRKALADHAKRSEADQRIEAMIRLAKNEEAILVRPEQFDSDPWSFNCLNGTLDLRTGELRPHRPEDFITKLAPVAYDPEAQAPTWQRFLETVLPDAEVRTFVQRMTGYGLTGDISEQAVFLFHGMGSNGKSTFLETIRTLFGEYAQQADFTTFLTKKSDAVRNDLARLAGSRLVSAVEAEEGKRLSEVVIKQVTGGDRITARFLHKEFFEFTPQFKLLLAANHMPEVRGTDYALWRRVKRIPFTVTVPTSQQDRRLPDKLKSELPGILAWAVKGCLDWQAAGLGEPDAVRSATDEYREEMDVVGRFLNDCCIFGQQAKAFSKDLYGAYVQWCQSNNEFVLTGGKFGRKLKERGLHNDKSTGGLMAWFGIGLNTATGTASGASGVSGPNSREYQRRDGSMGTSSNTGSTSSTSSTPEDDLEDLPF